MVGLVGAVLEIGAVKAQIGVPEPGGWCIQVLYTISIPAPHRISIHPLDIEWQPTLPAGSPEGIPVPKPQYLLKCQYYELKLKLYYIPITV